MPGGVPRHPCGIYTPSIHSEQFFGVLGHCPTMITHLGVYLKKAHESRVFGTLKKNVAIYILVNPCTREKNKKTF